MVRFTLRLPDDLHGALEYEARLNHRSLHGEIMLRLAESLEGTPERVLTEPGSGRREAMVAPFPSGGPEDSERGGGATLTSAEAVVDSRSVDGASSRVTAPAVAARSGKCSFDTPVGTKCKACGKVH